MRSCFTAVDYGLPEHQLSIGPVLRPLMTQQRRSGFVTWFFRRMRNTRRKQRGHSDAGRHLRSRLDHPRPNVRKPAAGIPALCEARGWTVKEYVDEGVTGAKDRRPALDELVKEARRRRFDVLVCWSLDRLGRRTSTSRYAAG